MDVVQPMKPTFKKSFAVPKQRPGGQSSDIKTKKKLFEDVKYTESSEDKEQEPSSSSEVTEDTEHVLEPNKENNITMVPPMKKKKKKKNLFLAPGNSEIDTKDGASQEKKKSKGTKKMLKEAICIKDQNSKPKKMKKKKDVYNTELMPHEAGPKLLKLDKVESNKDTVDADNEENRKNKQDHKEKRHTEKFDEQEDKTEDMTTLRSEPRKSLTDQEYKEIFQAVIDRCNNTTLDEMYESLKKPDKSISSNSKTSKNLTEQIHKVAKLKKTKQRKPVQVVPDIDDISDQNLDKHDRNNSLLEEKESQEIEEGIITKINDENLIEECRVISEIIPDNVVNDLHHLSSTVEPNFQDLNEVTPEGSEIEYKMPIQKTPPPKKSKKSTEISSNKKQKLVPKQLNFPVRSADSKFDKDITKEGIGKKKLHHVEPDFPVDEKDSKFGKDITKKDIKKKKLHHVEPDFPVDEKGNTKSESLIREKSRRKELQERLDTREKLGTWVQCGNKDCSKWRYLADCEDPSTLPEIWTCNINTDKKYNHCDAEEQTYDENEHIFTNFAEGSVVWAKMAGFPWWPAMVEIDPDTESYFTLLTPYSMYPSHYHVVFFDDKVSRAWINSASVRKFSGGQEDEMNLKPSKGGKGFTNYLKDLNKAKENALLALDMTVQDRLKNFSFAKRYKGVYCKVNQDDSSQETVKRNKQCKNRKRKMNVNSDLIDSTLKESIDDNEDELLKGFEEVLDALDEEEYDESDENLSDDMGKKAFNSNKGSGKISRDKRRRHKRHDKDLHHKVQKPEMFIVSAGEEEMVVPSIQLDSDIFTMDMDNSDLDDTSKDKTSKKKKDLVHTDVIIHSASAQALETSVPKTKSLGKKGKKHQVLKKMVCTEDSKTEQSSVDTEYSKDSKEDINYDKSVPSDCKKENFPLEQDEQTVPGEESSDSDELNLEMLNPNENKPQNQVVIHTITPVTVELAYDSDPMDIEE